MKKLIFLCLMLSGCSHAYVQRWDKEEIVTCCPAHKWFCSVSKLDELAKEQCGGRATPLRGEVVNNGGAMMTYGNGFANATATRDICRTYKCGPVGPIDASQVR